MNWCFSRHFYFIKPEDVTVMIALYDLVIYIEVGIRAEYMWATISVAMLFVFSLCCFVLVRVFRSNKFNIEHYLVPILLLTNAVCLECVSLIVPSSGSYIIFVFFFFLTGYPFFVILLFSTMGISMGILMQVILRENIPLVSQPNLTLSVLYWLGSIFCGTIIYFTVYELGLLILRYKRYPTRALDIFADLSALEKLVFPNAFESRTSGGNSIFGYPTLRSTTWRGHSAKLISEYGASLQGSMELHPCRLDIHVRSTDAREPATSERFMSLRGRTGTAAKTEKGVNRLAAHFDAYGNFPSSPPPRESSLHMSPISHDTSGVVNPSQSLNTLDSFADDHSPASSWDEIENRRHRGRNLLMQSEAEQMAEQPPVRWQRSSTTSRNRKMESSFPFSTSPREAESRRSAIQCREGDEIHSSPSWSMHYRYRYVQQINNYDRSVRGEVEYLADEPVESEETYLRKALFGTESSAEETPSTPTAPADVLSSHMATNATAKWCESLSGNWEKRPCGLQNSALRVSTRRRLTNRKEEKDSTSGLFSSGAEEETAAVASSLRSCRGWKRRKEGFDYGKSLTEEDQCSVVELVVQPTLQVSQLLPPPNRLVLSQFREDGWPPSLKDPLPTSSTTNVSNNSCRIKMEEMHRQRRRRIFDSSSSPSEASSSSDFSETSLPTSSRSRSKRWPNDETSRARKKKLLQLMPSQEDRSCCPPFQAMTYAEEARLRRRRKNILRQMQMERERRHMLEAKVISPTSSTWSHSKESHHAWERRRIKRREECMGCRRSLDQAELLRFSSPAMRKELLPRRFNSPTFWREPLHSQPSPPVADAKTVLSSSATERLQSNLSEREIPSLPSFQRTNSQSLHSSKSRYRFLPPESLVQMRIEKKHDTNTDSVLESREKCFSKENNHQSRVPRSTKTMDWIDKRRRKRVIDSDSDEIPDEWSAAGAPESLPSAYVRSTPRGHRKEWPKKEAVRPVGRIMRNGFVMKNISRFPEWFVKILIWFDYSLEICQRRRFVMRKATWKHKTIMPRRNFLSLFVDQKIERWYIQWMQAFNCRLYYRLTWAIVLTTLAVIVVEILNRTELFLFEGRIEGPAVPGIIGYSSVTFNIIRFVSNLVVSSCCISPFFFYRKKLKSCRYGYVFNITVLALCLTQYAYALSDEFWMKKVPTKDFRSFNSTRVSVSFTGYCLLVRAPTFYVIYSSYWLLFILVYWVSPGHTSISEFSICLTRLTFMIAITGLLYIRTLDQNRRRLFCKCVLPYALYLEEIAHTLYTTTREEDSYLEYNESDTRHIDAEERTAAECLPPPPPPPSYSFTKNTMSRQSLLKTIPMRFQNMRDKIRMGTSPKQSTISSVTPSAI